LPPKYKDIVAQVLQNSREIAVIKAILRYVILLPANHTFVKAAIATGEAYNQQVRDKGKNRELRSPHLHIVRAWLEIIRTRKGLSQDDAYLMDEDMAEGEGVGSTIESLEKAVEIAKSTKTWDERYLIQLSAHPGTKTEQVAQLMLNTLEYDGGEIEFDVAPKGPRERRIETSLKKSDISAE
jgi:hypothetical protein